MKPIESVKAIPRKKIIAVIKPIFSFFAGAIIAGSRILGEESLLTAALAAALPPVCGISAFLGAAVTAVSTGITQGKVSALTAAAVVLLTRFLFDGTSRRRYPAIASIVAAASYLGCAIFALATAEAAFSAYIRVVIAGAILAAATYLAAAVSLKSIFSATRPQLLGLLAFAVMIASSYHLGEILSFAVCTICVIKLTSENAALSSAARSVSLRLSFLSSALSRFPKFVNPGPGEHSFENMVELLALTESEISEGLPKVKSQAKCGLLCDILSKRTGATVSGSPLPDGAVELFLPKSARISENTVINAAERAGMGQGCEIFRSEAAGHIRLTVAPRPRWNFDAGICQIASARSEREEGICGDRAEMWRHGVYGYMILSDGMGTGREAAEVARNLTASFRNLTEAGYSLEAALRLSSEYIRTCQPDESFATLDVLSANLMTGEVRIRKCGAGKSYILTSGGITPLPQGGYPIGISEEISLTNTTITPEEEMTILMMTDGAESLGIEKLAEISSEQDSLSSDDLAAILTREAYKNQRENSRDDITVAVIRLSKNEKSFVKFAQKKALKNVKNVKLV